MPHNKPAGGFIQNEKPHEGRGRRLRLIYFLPKSGNFKPAKTGNFSPALTNISKSLGVPYDILFKKDTDDVSCSKHEIHILEKEIVNEVTKTIHEVFENK